MGDLPLRKGLSLPRSVSLNSDPSTGSRVRTPSSRQLRLAALEVLQEQEARQRSESSPSTPASGSGAGHAAAKDAFGRPLPAGFAAQEVAPRLWLGSMEAAWNAKELRARGITHILNATHEDEVENCFPEEFEYLRVSLYDVPRNAKKMQQHIDETNAFIERALVEKEEAILVHCAMGRSRSATFVLAYLVKVRRVPLDAALAQLREQRECVGPNIGFMQVLADLEFLTLDARSLDMKDYAAEQLLEILNPDGDVAGIDLALCRRAVQETSLDEFGLSSAMMWVERHREGGTPSAEGADAEGGGDGHQNLSRLITQMSI